MQKDKQTFVRTGVRWDEGTREPLFQSTRPRGCNVLVSAGGAALREER